MYEIQQSAYSSKNAVWGSCVSLLPPLVGKYEAENTHSLNVILVKKEILIHKGKKSSVTFENNIFRNIGLLDFCIRLISPLSGVTYLDSSLGDQNGGNKTSPENYPARGHYQQLSAQDPGDPGYPGCTLAVF